MVAHKYVWFDSAKCFTDVQKCMVRIIDYFYPASNVSNIFATIICSQTLMKRYDTFFSLKVFFLIVAYFAFYPHRNIRT